MTHYALNMLQARPLSKPVFMVRFVSFLSCIVQHRTMLFCGCEHRLIHTCFGIVLGALGDRFLSAQQPSVKRTELLKADLDGMAGKEGIMYIAELAPGAAAGKHFHPGPEFIRFRAA